MDASQSATFSEIEKVAIIEEQLRHNVVRTGVYFRLEVVHLNQAIRRRRMTFGKTRHTDAETAAIRMRSRFIESSNEPNQINRMLERVARFVVRDVARPVAPER